MGMSKPTEALVMLEVAKTLAMAAEGLQDGSLRSEDVLGALEQCEEVLGDMATRLRAFQTLAAEGST